MNIILIDIQGIIANGARSLSTRLKEKNHSVKLIFESSTSYRMICNTDYIYRYKQSVIDGLTEQCKGADLIGFTVMTNFFDRAQQLTIELKNKFSIPIIWGGIHPTMLPEECLEYADIVCIGEGEKTFVELVTKMEAGADYFDTKGFVFKRGGEVINNTMGIDLIKAEEIPAQDYSSENDYIIHKGRLSKISSKELQEFTNYQLPYSTSRGCTYRCAYCCNDAYLKLYPNTKSLRTRNLLDIVNELEKILKECQDFKSIFFNDDDFMIHGVDEFKKFIPEYKKRIKVPFSCIATPAYCSEEKMEMLFDAGLVCVHFGLQTVNKNVQRQYKRYISNEKVKEVTMAIDKYCKAHNRDDISIFYDIMLDSPFETDYERLNTIRFLLSFPIKFIIAFFSFTFYPGTSLTERAIREGIIKNEKRYTYRKTIQGPELNVINLIFYFTQCSVQNKIPRWIVKFLSSRFIFSILNRDVLNKILYYVGKYRYKLKYYYLEAENYV